MSTGDTQSADNEIVRADDFRGKTTSLEAVTRAEVDIQISTAKRYPRSITTFLSRAKSIIASDPEIAAKCEYAKPGKDREGKPCLFRGPSVRLAEIVACTYQNLRVVTRVTNDDGKTITIQASVMDLENNYGFQFEHPVPVTYRNGGRFPDFLVALHIRIGTSIAKRNAIFNVVPGTLVSALLEESKRVAIGDGKVLPDQVEKALTYFSKQGIKPADVFALLGVDGAPDIGFGKLDLLRGYAQAITDGEMSLGDLFPAAKPAVKAEDAPKTRTEAVAAKLAKGKDSP